MKKTKHKNDHPVVSVVVLSYNRSEYTAKTLEALTTVDAGIDFELIVVDNGFEAPAVELLTEWDKTGLIDKILFLPDNLGTSPGFNKGFSAAHPDSLFLTKLDNDIVVLSDNWLLEIVNTLNDEKDVGIATTDIINHGTLKKLPAITLPSGRNVKDWSAHRAGGGGMTFRKTLFYQLGGFREDFPSDLKLMPDDLEFHHKVTQAGLRSYYVCDSRSMMQAEHDSSYAEYKVWKARQYHLLRTRFFGLARGREYFMPFISELEYNGHQFKPGQKIVLCLNVTSSEDNLCWIGMGLSNTVSKRGFNDPYSDIIIKAKKGKASYMRWFHIPDDIEPGVYDVALSLYSATHGIWGERFDYYKEGGKITIE